MEESGDNVNSGSGEASKRQLPPASISSDTSHEDKFRHVMFNEVYKFDFHQVVRLMEAFTPGCVPLGEGVDPTKEALRLSSYVNFSFASNDLQSFNPADSSKPLKSVPTLVVNFMGLAGISKPLPTPYSHLVYQRVRYKDTAAVDFLDIFNHRFTSLLYRIHKKHRVELSTTPLENSIFGHCLSALSGFYIYTPSANNRMAITDRSILGFARYFWQRTQSAHDLQKMLIHYFQRPFRVEEYTGRWIKIDPSFATRLVSGYPSAFNSLGKDAVLGTRAWDQGDGITITLGAIDFRDYLTFLPGKSRYNPMSDLVRYYLGNGLTVVMDYVIRRETIPQSKLCSQPLQEEEEPPHKSRSSNDSVKSTKTPKSTVSRLGYTAWLASGSHVKDANGITVKLPRLET